MHQAETPIGSVAYNSSIMIVLAVILPEADSANHECPALIERPVAAAWTAQKKTLSIHHSAWRLSQALSEMNSIPWNGLRVIRTASLS